MADTQPTTKVPGDLGTYRKKKVTGTDGKITNTGDGLSQNMGLDPIIYEPGELVTFVVRTRVQKHTYEISEDGKEVVLVQVFKAGVMMPIDDDLVAADLNTMEARIQAVKDEQSGEKTLPGMDTGTGRRGGKSLAAVPDPE